MTTAKLQAGDLFRMKGHGLVRVVRRIPWEVENPDTTYRLLLIDEAGNRWEQNEHAVLPQVAEREPLKRFWLSWEDFHYGEWELHFPWWVSGDLVNEEYEVTGRNIVAAVRAEHEEAAKRFVLDCYDNPVHASNIRWRFCDQQASDWSPFTGRFPRGDWMQWPDEPEPGVPEAA